MAEETRDQIEEVIINEEPINEAVVETIIEEEEIKPKAKTKAKSRAKAKPKIKTTNLLNLLKQYKNEEEPIIEEPIVQVEPEQPKHKYILKKIVQCPDCGLSMTQHTLLYIHKRRGFCKAESNPKKNQNHHQNHKKQRLQNML